MVRAGPTVSESRGRDLAPTSLFPFQLTDALNAPEGGRGEAPLAPLPIPRARMLSGLGPSLAGTSSAQRSHGLGENPNPTAFPSTLPGSPRWCAGGGGLHYSGAWNIQAAGQRSGACQAG